MPYLFTPIAKQDTEQRIVYGIASTDTLDGQGGVMDGVPFVGDIVDPSAIEGALDDYMQWANVREMHNSHAAGTALAADIVDGKLMLAVKVVDDTAWKKVREGVYKGFSIGGRVIKAVLEKLPDGRYVRRILKLLLTEISLVDRPANPDARILVFKGTAMDKEEEEEKTEESPQALAALQKLAEKVAPQLQLQKASADPAKIVASIQAARNECELGGDMQGAQLYTQAIALVMQASGEADVKTEASETETSETSEIEESADAVALAAKATLKKAGKAISSNRMSALKQAAKALVQMAADAGDEECMAALKAFGVGAAPSEGEGVELAAKTLSSELEKVLTPFASAITSIDARLSKVEAQPVAGGPVLRPVEKQISSTKTPQTPQKPQMSNLIKAQLDSLWQKAHTDASPVRRDDYLKQYNDLKARYE
jgi:hypothetical protein